MSRIAWMLVVILGGFYFQNSSAIADEVSGTMDEEELRVYEVVLEQMYISHETKALVVAKRTKMDNMLIGTYENLRTHLPGLTKELAEAFEKRNNLAVDLARPPRLRVRVHLISPQSLDKLRNDRSGNFWAGFFIRYPNSPGYITLSRVGFNPSGTRSLVGVSRGCGATCGEGMLFLLEKHRRRWRIRGRTQLWVF